MEVPDGIADHEDKYCEIIEKKRKGFAHTGNCDDHFRDGGWNRPSLLAFKHGFFRALLRA